MRLRVGLTSLHGSVEGYTRRFDFLELRAEPGRLPTSKTLRKLRGESRERVAFALLVPPAGVVRLSESPADVEALEAAAEALGAEWIVLQTGPDLGPSARGRTRLKALSARLANDSRRVAWEPRGPWEPETGGGGGRAGGGRGGAGAARGFAGAVGITLVEDLSQVPGGGERVVYTRLRVQGPGARLASSALSRLGEELAGAEQAYVVVEGRGSPSARARIEQAIREAEALEGDESELEEVDFGDADEDEDEEGFEDEDEAAELEGEDDEDEAALEDDEDDDDDLEPDEEDEDDEDDDEDER